MSSRPVWKGHIKFNLVTVSIRLYTAERGSSSGTYFNQLHKGCNQRVRQPKTCPVHGRIEPHEIVSGYEYAGDQHVLVDKQEIAAARPASDKAINIASFVTIDTIDPSYFTGRNYYVLPDGDVVAKPYALLHRAMVESKRHRRGGGRRGDIGHLGEAVARVRRRRRRQVRRDPHRQPQISPPRQ